MAFPEDLVHSIDWPSPSLKKLILCKTNNHIDKLVERYSCLLALRTDLFYQDHTAKFSCGIHRRFAESLTAP